MDWLQDLNPDESKEKYFKLVGQIKQKLGPSKICTDRASIILPFVTEIFKMKFSDEPPYKKLKFQLIIALLKRNRVPDLRFDWSKFKKTQPAA